MQTLQQFGADFMFGLETGFWGDLSEHGNEGFRQEMAAFWEFNGPDAGPQYTKGVGLGATVHAIGTGAQNLGSWFMQGMEAYGAAQMDMHMNMARAHFDIDDIDLGDSD